MKDPFDFDGDGKLSPGELGFLFFLMDEDEDEEKQTQRGNDKGPGCFSCLIWIIVILAVLGMLR